MNEKQSFNLSNRTCSYLMRYTFSVGIAKLQHKAKGDY